MTREELLRKLREERNDVRLRAHINKDNSLRDYALGIDWAYEQARKLKQTREEKPRILIAAPHPPTNNKR